MSYEEAKKIVVAHNKYLIEKWSPLLDNPNTDCNMSVLIESQEAWVKPEYTEEQKRLQEARNIVNDFEKRSLILSEE